MPGGQYSQYSGQAQGYTNNQGNAGGGGGGYPSNNNDNNPGSGSGYPNSPDSRAIVGGGPGGSPGVPGGYGGPGDDPILDAISWLSGQFEEQEEVEHILCIDPP